MPPKALSNLRNMRNDDISREISVVIHSEGKEARKLEVWRVPRKVASPAVLTWEIGFFGVLR